jgi:GNAT superfamily N-acetyltransferase
MPDMLVKLYDLPDVVPYLENLKAYGIEVRRALAPDKNKIVTWVSDTFGDRWAGECDVAFCSKPVSCFIAVENKKNLAGFACYDVICKDYFGPTGVSPALQRKGIGKALLLECLYAMKEQGYAYAIIGGAEDSIEFYRRTAGASVIEGSSPGIYRGMIGFE